LAQLWPLPNERGFRTRKQRKLEQKCNTHGVLRASLRRVVVVVDVVVAAAAVGQVPMSGQGANRRAGLQLSRAVGDGSCGRG